MSTHASFLADHALTRRIESAWDRVSVENARSALRRRPDCGAEVLAVGGGHAVFLGPGSPLSQAQGLGFDGPAVESEVARMEAFFRERSAPCRVEVASTADASLLPLLSARGFDVVELTHMLALPLDDAFRAAGAGDRTAGTVKVERVGPNGVEDWVDVVLGGFFENQEPPPTLREGAIAMAQAPCATIWLATLDGRPAGGATLLTLDGLGLMAGDAALPEFRGRGVQAALLSARLDHARQAGCDLAATCTQPASGSQRNAERQGFGLVHARVMMSLG